ncbi:hypothetical protein MRY87_00335 [bacterium]|nr:hypothetical protein [bacterium]
MTRSLLALFGAFLVAITFGTTALAETVHAFAETGVTQYTGLRYMEIDTSTGTATSLRNLGNTSEVCLSTEQVGDDRIANVLSQSSPERGMLHILERATGDTLHSAALPYLPSSFDTCKIGWQESTNSLFVAFIRQPRHLMDRGSIEIHEYDIARDYYFFIDRWEMIHGWRLQSLTFDTTRRGYYAMERHPSGGNTNLQYYEIGGNGIQRNFIMHFPADIWIGQQIVDPNTGVLLSPSPQYGRAGLSIHFSAVNWQPISGAYLSSTANYPQTEFSGQGMLREDYHYHTIIRTGGANMLVDHDLILGTSSLIPLMENVQGAWYTSIF